jgi:hypothetical protein
MSNETLLPAEEPAIKEKASSKSKSDNWSFWRPSFSWVIMASPKIYFCDFCLIKKIYLFFVFRLISHTHSLLFSRAKQMADAFSPFPLHFLFRVAWLCARATNTHIQKKMAAASFHDPVALLLLTCLWRRRQASLQNSDTTNSDAPYFRFPNQRRKKN